MRKILGLSFTVVAIACFSKQALAQAVGVLAGGPSINSTGAFTYSIPIALPPGLGGLVPQLSLNYNSQGGNGLLGMGWSMTGISAISRTPSDLYHDLVVDAINFNSNDQYTLDGQRLMKTGSGTYSTFLQDFSKITSVGTHGSGPYQFKVETKDGLVYEYGTDLNSKLCNQDGSEVIVWGLTKVTDQYNNYAYFHYYNDVANGVYMVDYIEYGKNSFYGTITGNKIEFNYEWRGDKNRKYVHGARIYEPFRLKNIIIKNTGTTVHTYTMEYNEEMYAYSFYSHLIKITETGQGGSSLPSTIFNWGSTTPTSVEEGHNTGVILSDNKVDVGDFDGDGYTDCIGIGSGSFPAYKVFYNNKYDNFTSMGTGTCPGISGSTVSYSYNAITGKETKIGFGDATKMSLDWNGDGKDDLLIISKSSNELKIFIKMSNWTGNFYDAIELLDYTGSEFEVNDATNCIGVGDFLGNGKKQLVVATPAGGVNYDVWLIGDKLGGPDTDFFKNKGTITGYFRHFQPMDFDGDGKDEIFGTPENDPGVPAPSRIITLGMTIDAATSVPVSGSTITLTSSPSLTYPSGHHRIYFGDFNGDGKKDVLTWKSGDNWEIGYSTGKDFDKMSVSSMSTLTNDPGAADDDDNVRVADFNGDGKDDILHMRKSPGSSFTFELRYSKGGNSFITDYIVPPGLCGVHDSRISVGDFNGDGQSDLLFRDFPGCYMRIMYFRKGEQKQLITSIEQRNNNIPANGMKYTVTYVPMPQDPEYIPTGLSYPFNNVPIGGLKLAKTLKDNIVLDKRYVYSGSCLNRVGLGYRGFQGFYEYDYGMNQRTEHSFDIYNYAAVVPITTSIYTPVTGSTLITTTTSYYQQDNLPGYTKFIYPVWEETLDKINNKKVRTDYSYTSWIRENYGLPDKITTNVSDQEVSTKVTTYGTTDPKYFNKFKPISCTTMIQRPGQPLYKRITQRTYTDKGSLSTATADPGTTHESSTKYTYDNFGNMTVKMLTAYALPTLTYKYKFSSDGRFLIESIDAFGRSEFYTYNAWGKMLTEKTINNLTTTYTYDDFNRKIKEVSPTGVVTTTKYEWANTLSTVPSSTHHPYISVTNTNSGILGSAITFLDFYGRTIRTVSNSFNGVLRYVNTTYNNDGTVATTTDPYLAGGYVHTTTYNYDIYKRKIKETNTSRTINTSYNFISVGVVPSGLEVTVTNASPVRSVTTTYDATGQEIKVAEPGTVLAKVYHSNGKVAKIVINSSSVTQYTYDDYGNILSENAPNKNTTSHSYDARDRVTKKTDANSITYSFLYDNADRLLSKTGPEGTYNYEYDGTSPNTFGRLLRETTPFAGTETKYTYDAYSRTASISEMIAGTTFTNQYTYDVYGRLVKTIFPSGDHISRGYNSWGYFSSLNSSTGGTFGMPYTIWQKNAQNAYGHTTEASYLPSSIPIIIGSFSPPPLYKETTTFNPRGFLTGSKVVNMTGATIKNFSYNIQESTYDMKTRTDVARGLSENFDYDNLDRLTKVTYYMGGLATGGELNMAYSQQGNILKKSDISSYDWNYNKYAVVSIPAPTTVIPTFTQTAVYTQFDRVKTITEGDKKIEFTYKANWQRGLAKYYTAGVLTQKRYYADNYEETIDAAGNVEKICYIMADDRPVAMYVRNGSSYSLKFIVTDHLGSITHILNTTGIQEERSYDAWGRSRTPNLWAYTGLPSYHFDRGYIGQEHLRNFNVINLNARLYDPLIGRMFGVDRYVADPSKAQAYNSYSYSLNNPLKYSDPSGNNPLVIPIIIGAVAGAYMGGSIANHNPDPTKWDYSSGRTWAYMGCGAVVGGLAGAAGATVASGGGFMANTMGIVVSSEISAGGTFIYTQGQTDVSIGFGAGSFNMTTGEFRGIWDWGNLTTAEKIGYTCGALANVQDITAGIHGTSVAVKSRPRLTGHSEINGEYNSEKILISVGNVSGEPQPRLEGMAWEYQFFKLQMKGTPWPGENVSYIQSGDPQIVTKINNINGKLMVKWTNKLSNGLKLMGQHKLIYGANNGCVNFTSRALFLSGVLNVNAFLPVTAPVLLNAELALRQAGIWASPFLINR